MKKSCAIIECYDRHDEVYLTTAHLMNRLGYDVELHTTWRNRLRNSFVYAGGVQRHMHTPPFASALLDARRYEGCDLVIFNSLEGERSLQLARALIGKVPAIGFVHNAWRIKSDAEYLRFGQVPNFRFATLAPYISRNVAPAADAMYQYPMFFHDQPVPRLPNPRKLRRFCVQGYFDPQRRQYSLLVDALEQLRREGADGFEVYVMGRSLAKTFVDFDRDLRRRGIAPYVRYTWKGIGYRTYYRLLNSVDFILPLISPTSHKIYFEYKATSSVVAAVGFGNLCILDETLARHYGVEAASFTYDTDLAGAMRRALNASDAELATMRAAADQARENGLNESLDQFRRAISSIEPVRAGPLSD